jgi:hypothetical protein
MCKFFVPAYYVETHIDTFYPTDYYLSALCSERQLHVCGVGELCLIPSKVTFSVRVLNIKPEYIIRNVMLVKSSIHLSYILLSVVVPATLVVGNRKGLGHGGRTDERRVLAEDITMGWAQEDKDIQDA